MLGGAGVGIAGRIDGSAATYYELVYLPERNALAAVAGRSPGATNEIGSYTQTLTAGADLHRPAVDDRRRRSASTSPARCGSRSPTRAAITAAGHAGLAFRGAGPATATTGLHIGELRTDDVAEPEATITFVAAGTSASATSPATVTPGLPGGVAANDLLVMAIYGVDGVRSGSSDRLDGADQRRRDGRVAWR